MRESHHRAKLIKDIKQYVDQASLSYLKIVGLLRKIDEL